MQLLLGEGGIEPDIKVPQLSESVAEATLLQWKKQPGEAVATDQILIEIETDVLVNSTTNIPLWIGDVIKIMKPGGTVVRGVYRIVAIPSMSFERETNDAIVRRAVYRCLYLSAG